MTQSVLVFRIGSLGDTVVALPCFHHIARAFPGTRRVLITDTPASEKAPPAESVLAGSGLIDEVIHFPPPPRKLGDFLRLRAAIRASGAKTLIYVADRSLRASVRDVVFFRLCGVRRVVGAPFRRDLRVLRIDQRTGETEREAERLARTLGSLGELRLNEDAVWDLRLRAEEHRSAELALAPLGGRPFIAVNLGGKVASKDWGDANWLTLLGTIARCHPAVAFVFFGSAGEAERARGMAAEVPGNTLVLCGLLAPRESAAAMQRARLFIGHDSGPLHLAAAVGVTCVGLYGDFNVPKAWHPWGERHHIIHNLSGMAAIKPPEVVEAVAAALDRGEHSESRESDEPGRVGGHTREQHFWT